MERDEWNQKHAKWKQARSEEQRRELKAYEHPYADSGHIFTWENGRAYHPEYLSQVFTRLVEKLQLPPVRLHDLRHCAATLSLAAGVHMKVIQALLGHSSFKLTADTYTSVLPQMEQAAADAPVSVVPRKGREGRTAEGAA